MNVPQKAVVTQVSVGLLEIEGLMMPDGSFGVAVPQIAKLFQYKQNTISRDLKRLLGAEFSPSKIRTELGRQMINVVTLSDFEKITFELAMKGNKNAQEFVRALYGLSLNQLFCDAFDIKFEKKERQEYLKARQIHKQIFHPQFTIWAKRDGCSEGWEYAKRVNQFKTLLGLPLINVEEYDSDQQWILNKGELKYDTLRTTGMNHQEAIAYF